MLVRAPMLVPLRPEPDLKLPATASPEQRVTWLDTASRMPTVESAARVPDQAPPGETVNVVAASAGAATNATAATTNVGEAEAPDGDAGAVGGVGDRVGGGGRHLVHVLSAPPGSPVPLRGGRAAPG